MGTLRTLIMILLLLAALAAAFTLTNKPTNNPEPSPQDTPEETTPTPETLNTPTPLLSIEGRVLSALLTDDTLITINLTREETTPRVTLLSYDLSKQGERTRIDLTSLCSNTRAEYRPLGLSQSKAWVYFELKCAGEASSKPLLIALNLVDKTPHPLPITPESVVALGEGTVIVRKGVALIALGVGEGEILWSHEYLSSYVFPGSNRVFQGVLKAGIMRDRTLLAVFTDRELSDTPLHVTCIVKADAQSLRETCLEHPLPPGSNPLSLGTRASFNAESGAVYLLTTALPLDAASPSILWLDIIDIATLSKRGEWESTLKGVDPGYPVLLFTDEEGATVVLAAQPSPSRPHEAMGGLAIRVGVKGVEEWRRSLAEGERVLHAWGDLLYIYRDGVLYVANSTGPLEPVARVPLSGQVNPLGLLLPAVFFPLILTQEQPTAPLLLHFQGESLYMFDGKTLYKTTLATRD